MRVLVDAHHADLLEAMHRLWEDRLGMEVYVPYGMEWFERGFAPYGREDVARQFLVSIAEHSDFHPRKLRLLRLSEFVEMDDWAVICATMAEQQWGFHDLAQRKGARFVVVVGNVRQYVDARLEPFVLGPGGLPYHQEFDKDGDFRFSPPPENRHRVASFVNIFSLLPDAKHYLDAQALLPGWECHTYGHHGMHGFIKPTSAIADLMRTYGFAWHDKETGDGYGHVIHYWAAIGRPLIGHGHYYNGQLASDLWDDLVTCIDLDRHSIPETVQLMQGIAADPPRYDAMCRAIRARIDARIDYPREAAAIADALGLRVPVAA